MNLQDLLNAAGGGKSVSELGSRLNLGSGDMGKLVDAVAPALMRSFQKEATSPDKLAALAKALERGDHDKYVDRPETMHTEEAEKDGNSILGHLFGNRDVSRAVASHAAASTGIDSSLLKKMLPVLANMVMGSLFKGAKGASGSRRGGGLGGALGGALGQAAGGGILGQIIEGLAGGALGGAMGNQSRRRRAPTRRGGGGSLEDLLGGLLGGGRRSAPQRRTRDPIMPAPRRRQRQGGGGQGGGLGDILDQLAGGSGRSQRRANPYAPKPPQRQRRRPRGELGEIFGDMLEPGGNTAPEYRRETGSVFDQFLGSR